MAIIDNFNSYSDGDLNGQGSWSGSTKFDVQGTTVQEGAKAITIVEDGSGGSIEKSITAQTSGIFGIYMRRSSTNGDTRFILKDSSSNKFRITFTESGNIVFTVEAISDTTIITGFSIDTWYFCEIEIDQINGRGRGRVDNGAWTAWGSISFTNINTIQLNCGDGISGASFLDLITHSPIIVDSVQSPSTQVITASLPTRTISIKETITPSAQVTTFSIPAYFVLAGDILVQAAAQVVTASIPVFSVLLDRVFGVAAQVATFSLPSRTVSIKETLTPAAQVATFSIPAYSIQFIKIVTVGVQTAMFSIPAYSITAETTVHQVAQVTTFSIPAYSIGLGMVTTPLTQLLTFTLPTLYKVGAIWTKIARQTNATWSRTSRNSN